MKKYWGIDIGGTSVKMGIVSENAEILFSEQYDVAFDNYETPILETVLKSSELFLDKFDINVSELSGIGVSATGQVNTLEGKIAGTGGNIKNWSESPIKKSFEDKYGLTTCVVNDANCVALGEKWAGAAKNTSNFIVITVGTGLGGGIIAGGNILLGQFGYAGELGHFSIDKNGRECTCRNKGCFEQYASMTALIKDVNSFYEKNPEKKFIDKINGKLIFDEIEKGNKDLEAISEEWIDNIAAGAVSLIHIFNPELFIVGGAVCSREKLFISKLRKRILSKVMPNFADNLQICAAKLGNNAGLVGAVAYLRKNGTGE